MEDPAEYATGTPRARTGDAAKAEDGEAARLRTALASIRAYAEDAAKPSRYKTAETLRANLLEIAARCEIGTPG